MKHSEICVLNKRNGHQVVLNGSPIIEDFLNESKKSKITIDMLLDRINLIHKVYNNGDCDERLFERELCACEYVLDSITLPLYVP